MKNYLVTGGAGFIGGSLVDRLMQSKENNVMVLDNLLTSDGRYVSIWQSEKRFRLVKADIADTTILNDLIEKSDIVFHLAANPNVRLGSTDSTVDFRDGLQATHLLLEAMKKSTNCKKIIFTSSSTVYGEPSVIPTPESYSPLIPVSLYGASKLACESLISGYCHMFGMKGTIVRLANVVGSRNKHGVIHDFLKKLQSNPSHLDILGDGSQNKSYIHIDDCIDALMRVANNKSTFDIFNVGSRDRIAVVDIARLLIGELSLRDVDLIFINEHDGRGWKGDVKEMLLDCRKLESLGWSLRYNSTESVKLTIKQLLKETA